VITKRTKEVTMLKIDAHSRTVRQLLSGVKYSIDYYQREFKWETKNISELLEDLETKFLDSHKEGHERTRVETYGHYFLGSIVINQEKGQRYIIDGQQRLTSLTLLLIYLHNFQKDRDEQVDVRDLIFSERYGKKTYNFDVPERAHCIDALFKGKDFDPTGESESVRNIHARYSDLAELFPETLQDNALPFFIDWLLDNVELVEISAYSDDDAYTIFETMNDRGLSLSPTDMLKGYLLANIDGGDEKARANSLWKERILDMVALNREEDADFFKAWLRAKYAETIRERKRGSTNKDFERIGTTFHKWIRDERTRIALIKSSDFYDFAHDRFGRFSQHYLRVRKAAQMLTPGLEYIFYNADNNFTLQYPLVLAPVQQEDDLDVANRKIRLVAGYIDIFIARRVWNFRTLGYSSIVYTMFNLMREIRDKTVPDLVAILNQKVDEMDETFQSNDRFRLHQQNGHQVHRILARLTRHIEEQCGVESSFASYIARDIKKPFEIEHIWANNYQRHQDEFGHPQDFADYRNRIGGLLLLPRGFNQSLGGDAYETKVQAYFGQNLLAKSLNPQCYQNNPAFYDYIQRSGLPFHAHAQLKKADLDERQKLYTLIAEEVWSPDRFDKELN
jgi:uncharacterized protein with ParB-like and HNH nuclease domain